MLLLTVSPCISQDTTSTIPPLFQEAEVMYNPKQQRWGVWVSDPKSREISKGLERGDLLRDLGIIISTHLDTCEAQLQRDEEIFANYDMEIDSLMTMHVNDSLIIANKNIEINGLTDEFKSQRRQKWGVTLLGLLAAYFAIFK